MLRAARLLFPLGRRVVFAAVAVALGCGGGAVPQQDAAADGAVDPACVNRVEGEACDGLGPLGSKASCRGGRCLPGCEGDPARTPCSTFSDLPISCCTTEQQCCFVGNEEVGCRPAGTACPAQ
jgi:hypothetical protein